MSINYDFIGTSKPINSTASKCLSNGEHFDFKRTETAYCSKDPLETKKFTGDKSFDLTGLLFGEFKVMGYLAFYKQGVGLLGVVVVTTK